MFNNCISLYTTLIKVNVRCFANLLEHTHVRVRAHTRACACTHTRTYTPLFYILPSYLSNRRMSAHIYLPFLQLSLMGLLTTAFMRSTAFYSYLQHICLLTKVNRLLVQGFRGLPANCQLVNLIGLSPWALFLNQLGNELAVTSFSQEGLLEESYPIEVKHSNEKVITSATDVYHLNFIFNVILTFYGIRKFYSQRLFKRSKHGVSQDFKNVL